MSGFTLDPKLEADTIPVMDLRLCTVRLMNDSRYPWVILVPRAAGLEEMFQLKRAEQALLMEEMNVTAQAIQTISNAAKMNVGALGNIVRQLHIHVIARFENDAAWPGPVWGVGKAVPYTDQGDAFLSLLRPQISEALASKK